MALHSDLTHNCSRSGQDQNFAFDHCNVRFNTEHLPAAAICAASQSHVRTTMSLQDLDFPGNDQALHPPATGLFSGIGRKWADQGRTLRNATSLRRISASSLTSPVSFASHSRHLKIRTVTYHGTNQSATRFRIGVKGSSSSVKVRVRVRVRRGSGSGLLSHVRARRQREPFILEQRAGDATDWLAPTVVRQRLLQRKCKPINAHQAMHSRQDSVSPWT